MKIILDIDSEGLSDEDKDILKNMSDNDILINLELGLTKLVNYSLLNPSKSELRTRALLKALDFSRIEK